MTNHERRVRLFQEERLRAEAERQAESERLVATPTRPTGGVPLRPRPDDVREPEDWVTEATRQLRAIRERYRPLAEQHDVRELDFVFEEIDRLPDVD